MNRTATITRTTKETSVAVTVGLDGSVYLRIPVYVSATAEILGQHAAGQVAPPHGLCLWEVGYPGSTR